MKKVLRKNNSTPTNAAPSRAVTKTPKLRPRHRHARTAKGSTLSRVLDDRFAVLEQVLRFRNFLESGFDPKISDAEIVVMFADVRGFTKYCRTLQGEMQDRKIQNFLGAYFKIFAEGLLHWVVER